MREGLQTGVLGKAHAGAGARGAVEFRTSGLLEFGVWGFGV